MVRKSEKQLSQHSRRMKKLISPKQVARAIGVSESTLKRWCDRGLIPMIKTAGGHRRMEVEAVVRFLRDSGHEIVEPELLGLPAAAGQTGWTLKRARQMLVPALVKGDESVARQIVFDLLLAGHSVTAIFDDVVAPAFHEIGNQWDCGDVAVYQERRACEICMRILRELRATVTSAQPTHPIAIGATLEHDIYTLPVTMAEVVLRSVGWQSTSLGTNLPSETLIESIKTARARLFWLSVSFIKDEPSFITSVNSIFETTDDVGCALAIGGQAVNETVRRKIQYTTFCETFRDLEMFAHSLNRVTTQPTPPPAVDS
ncbi:MAG: DNA-binding protein [Planctomycetaceae bacterium]|nr:DNA-binding protein [Planctomycetaceae bacterium]